MPPRSLINSASKNIYCNGSLVATSPRKSSFRLLNKSSSLLKSSFSVPPTMNSGNGWKRPMTKAFEVFSAVSGRKITPGKGLFRIFLLHLALRPENSSGELYGFPLKHLCKFEVSKS